MHRSVRPAALVAAAATAALVLPATPAAADIVYDSYSPSARGLWFIHDNGETSSSVELPGGAENEAQAGDLIVLAGSERHLTDVRIRIRGFGFFLAGPSADVTLRLWEADGDLPGALLWSGTQNLALPGGSNPLAEAAFAPGISVPDTLIFTFAFDNILGPSSGPSRFGAGFLPEAPSIGTSSHGGLWQDTTTLDWHIESQFHPLNLEARFTAIPAPTGTLLALAAALTAARRRR